jgi:putative sigma-54 modulation protein
MKASFTFRKMDSTDAIKQHVMNKLKRLERYEDSEVTVQVTLGVEKIHRSVELHATLHGQTFVSHEKRGDMYEAIDVCVDKLNRQISKKKSKLKHHKGQQPTSSQITS